ncbi:MAG TPA: guanylate kinase [Terriglobia bacterium]
MSRTLTSSPAGSVIVISAPSGAGKTTFAMRLLRSVPGLRFSVSHTTRRPRPGERDGREYFFVSRRIFERMVARGEFLEWAEVYGNLYGTSWKALRQAQATGRDVLLDIDVQGHRQVRQRLSDAISIFLLPPSFEELARRLRRRHSDTPEVIERRLADARQEVRRWREYDFLIVNDVISAAERALRAVVVASRCRRVIQQRRASEIARTFGG